MKVLGSLLIGYALTLLVLGVAMFYVAILVTRFAWLCRKVEALWREHRSGTSISQPGDTLSTGVRPQGI